MKAAQLRQSILQAAVQGKLVPQNVHDEPADKLLERIRAEKAWLVKEGKIKKEKSLPPISEDEAPYDLPDGWSWCKLGNIATKVHYGYTASAQNKGTAKLLRITDIQDNKVTWSDVPYCSIEESQFPDYKLNPYDILIARTGGTIGKTYLVSNIVEDAVFASYLIRVVPFPDLYRVEYLKYFLESPLYWGQLREKTMGTGQPNVNGQSLSNLILPLPPLDEQQRIIAKVDELMALCDELEAAEKELDKLETDFAEYLPKSILQAAVQGKLVPQNIHDELADKLLERIRAEKAQLVKEGKIKKGKSLPPITEDEIPYDLPEGWIWCRLSDILHNNIGGGTPSKQNPDYWNGNIHWASVKDLNCTVLTTTQDAITELGLNESTSNLIPKGNVIICTRMGLGKIVVNDIPVAINQDLRALMFSHDKVDHRYFIYWYKTLSIIGEGMTVKGIKIEDLNRMLFPLPPLAEQLRIVAKVDELMALCSELKEAKNITPVTSIPKVISFPTQADDDGEEIRIAARGDVQGLSDEAMRDIDELFGDEAND